MFLVGSKFLIIKGKDSKKFLQGIITNDINELQEGKLLYTLMLSPKGRFLYDFFIFQLNKDEILIEYNVIYEESLVKSLSIYNLHKSVEISEAEYFSYINLDGNINFNKYEDPRSKELGYKIFTKEKLKVNSNQSLIKEYNINRIKNLIPDCSVDLVSGSSFPLEYNLEYAFSFKKGCYVGQEVTMRFKIKNQLKRKLFLIKSDGKFPDPHTELKINNEIIGKILSNTKDYALALLNLEFISQIDKKNPVELDILSFHLSEQDSHINIKNH